MKKVKMRLKTREEYPSFYDIYMEFGFEYRTDLGHVYEKNGVTVKGKRIGFTDLPTLDVSKVAKALLEWKQSKFAAEKKPTHLLSSDACDVVESLIRNRVLVFDNPSDRPAPVAFPLRPSKTILIDMTLSNNPVRIPQPNEVVVKNNMLDNARKRLLQELDHAGVYYEKSPYSIATEEVLYIFNLRMKKRNRKVYDEVILVDAEMKGSQASYRWHALMIDRLFQMSVPSSAVSTYYMWNEQTMTVDVIEKSVGQRKPTLAFSTKEEVLAYASDLYEKRLRQSKVREESLKQALATERKDRRHLEKLLATVQVACLD